MRVQCNEGAAHRADQGRESDGESRMCSTPPNVSSQQSMPAWQLSSPHVAADVPRNIGGPRRPAVPLKTALATSILSNNHGMAPCDILGLGWPRRKAHRQAATRPTRSVDRRLLPVCCRLAGSVGGLLPVLQYLRCSVEHLAQFWCTTVRE